MPLTDMQIRTAKPGARLDKLSDGGGLQLWVMPDGARRWRLAYRFGGKQKLLAIGVYPKTGLRGARAARDEAKRLLAEGNDPSSAKKTARATKAAASANSFDAIAGELLAKKTAENRAPRTIEKLKWFLRIIGTTIGALPISEITAPEILAVLRPVEARGRHETARRLRATIGEVFRYAVATGRADADPTGALKGALVTPTVRHRAAIVEPKAFGGVLRAIAAYEGAPETQAALKLAALTFVRPGELRAAEWGEFDLDSAIWSIPSQRMKMRRPHKVPLAPQAIAILNGLRAAALQDGFLFPGQGARGRCMSENTINGALRRLGFAKEEMSGHGFRSAASSMLNESGLWNPDAIEAQLAHVEANAVRKAYARAEFWEERVRMMGWWADRCDEMRGAPLR